MRQISVEPDNECDEIDDVLTDGRLGCTVPLLARSRDEIEIPVQQDARGLCIADRHIEPVLNAGTEREEPAAGDPDAYALAVRRLAKLAGKPQLVEADDAAAELEQDALTEVFDRRPNWHRQYKVVDTGLDEF